MIYYKTDDEIEIIKENADILGKTHGEVAKRVKPGVKTAELDEIAYEFINDHGGIPSFKNYQGFPFSLCISPNEQIVHGFPGEYELKEGDILSIDCGVYKNEFHSDSAFTYAVGEVDEEREKLLQVTRDALYKGIEAANEGGTTGDIGFAIQKKAEKAGFSVVRELIGHGVGKNLHESPEVPNYGKKGKGTTLKDGLVIAIEPMINAGTRKIKQKSDGWTIVTADGKPSAHFEHTIVIRKSGPEILSTFDYIEKELNKV